MTTQTFIDNHTFSTFELYDLDNHLYATVRGGQRYSLTLPFSESFDKQYQLLLPGTAGAVIIFTININGLLELVQSNSPAYTVYKTTASVTNWFDDNLLVINYAGLIPPNPIIPTTPPGVLYYDDY